MTMHSNTPTCATCGATFPNDKALDDHMVEFAKGGRHPICPNGEFLYGSEDEGVPWDVDPEYTDGDGALTDMYCCCCGEKLKHALELDTGICDACTDVDHRPHQADTDLPEFEDMLDDGDGDGSHERQSKNEDGPWDPDDINTSTGHAQSNSNTTGYWQQFRY